MNSLDRELFAGIGTLVVILSFVFVYYAGDSIPPTLFTSIDYYEESNHNSCHVIVTEPQIVIRIDDIQNHNAPIQEMLVEILRRNMSATIGVIPERIGHEPSFDAFLYGIAQHPNIEIAVHGSDHTESDINISYEELEKGYERVATLTGRVPVTYIPPFNTMTGEAYSRAERHYNIISMTGGSFRSGERAARIDQTVETYDYERQYSTHQGPSDIPSIVGACKEALLKNNLCVVNFHPQELSTVIENATDINRSKYIHFLTTLDALENIGVEFTTLQKTTRCVE